ncbi:MAG: leucine-rich repeat protein [Lachnospiraceae bacterium]
MRKSLILILFIMIMLISQKTLAVTIPTSGYCGEDGNEESVMWNYADGVITISGEGRMADYPHLQGYKPPWYPYEDEVEKVIFSGDITYVGDSVFRDFCYIREVQFPENLKEIGPDAFSWCMRLTSIEFPQSLEKIDKGAFEYSSLTRINVPGTVEEITDDSFFDILYDTNWGTQYLTGILDEDEQYCIVQLNEGTKVITGRAFESGISTRYLIRTAYLPASMEQISISGIRWDMINAIYGKNDYVKNMAEKNYAVYVDATKEYDISNAICLTDLNSNMQSRPEIQLSYMFGEDEVLLNEEIDYSISYAEEENGGTITITGKGCYVGSKVISYTIYREITKCSVELENSWYYRTGSPIEPKVTVIEDGNNLEYGKDYTLRYEDNIQKGQGKVIVSGKGNYIGNLEKKFDIRTKSISSLNIQLSQTEFYYDGKPHIPEVTIMDGDKKLVEGEDYAASVIGDAIYPGEVMLRITSVGNGMYHEDTYYQCSYYIQRALMESASVTLSQTSYIYDGLPKTPSVMVYWNGQKLEENVDYTVTYLNNVEEGYAYASVEGIGFFQGIVVPEFLIEKKEPSIEEQLKDPVDICNVSISPVSEYTYCGEKIEPDVNMTYQGKPLIKNQDYTITYQNNLNAGTGKIILKGKNLYTGEYSISFTIKPYDVSGLSDILKGKDGKIYKAVYSGKKIELLTAFRIPITNDGKKIYLEPKKNEDYTFKYQDNKKIGTASIIYTFKGNYSGKVVKRFQIVPAAPKIKSVKKSGKTRIVKWGKVGPCDYYEIYRSTSLYGEYKKIAKVTGKCSYTDKKVKNGKKYYYRIRACKKVKKEIYQSALSDRRGK